MKPPLLYEQNALCWSPNSARILADWACVCGNCEFLQRKQRSATNPACAHFLGSGHTLHNTQQNVFFLVGVSQRPQVPREPTPNKLRANKLRTNSEQAPNELRTNSERTPNELRTNSEQTPNELRANSERTPNELRANSERTPDKLRTNSEQTPNKLRTNSGRTQNKLRTSEQAPSELWHCSRANSEHTLAISMFLSPGILVAKLFFFAFSGLPKGAK